jgi:hypothetical protein
MDALGTMSRRVGMVFGTNGETPLKVDRLQGLVLAAAIVAAVAVLTGLAFLVLAAFVLNNPTGELISLPALVAAAGFAWYRFNACVTVWPDRIESKNGYFSRSLLRSNVSGYRHRQKGKRIALIPRDEFAKPVVVSRKLIDDPATEKWFEGLPDLDAQDYQAASDALQNDHRLGNTVVEREQRLQMLKKIATRANLLGLVVGVWALFWPEPYEIPVFIAIAAVPTAIVLHFWSRGILSLAASRIDPRPTVLGLLFVPALAVAIHGFANFNSLDAKPEFAWAAGFAIALSVLVFARDEAIQARKLSALFIAIALSFYAYGVIVELNAVFDQSTARVFSVPIADKHVIEGKRTAYYIVLAAWGDQPADQETRVSYDFYQSTYVGETVCVHLRSGLFGFRHYYIRNAVLITQGPARNSVLARSDGTFRRELRELRPVCDAESAMLQGSDR